MGASTVRPMLSDLDRAILDLEGLTFRYPGSKIARITDLGLSESRYYQRLIALSKTEPAWAYAPNVCKRVSAGRKSRLLPA